jgi:DNA mismatch repair protein MutS
MPNDDLTPLMRQYRETKRGYHEAILFFRVGDFYEMFYEDAEEASRLLSIALTTRDKNSPDPIPLCGVPHHAVTGYIARLLKAGRTVALCDQVEDPKLAKGLVRREVVRVYTPGTLIDPELLAPTASNFLAAIALGPHPSRGGYDALGLAAIDVSTGEFWVTEAAGEQAEDHLVNELARLEAKELLIPQVQDEKLPACLTRLKDVRLCREPIVWFTLEEARALLLGHFRVQSLDSFGCRGMTLGIQAAGAVLRYLRETQPTVPLDHVRALHIRRPGDAMHLDGVTIQNLELVRSFAAPGGAETLRESTLLGVLDRTVTAMGGRLLREWVLHPLLDCRAIRSRQATVGELKERLDVRVALRAALRHVQDISRLSGRISLGVATPREVLVLKQSVGAFPELHRHLLTLDSPLAKEMARSWDLASDIHEVIEQALATDAPISVRDGGIIRAGYHAGVDELRKACTEGKQWIAALETQERARTGIESLKVRYNQVFGYYIEVTKANLGRVPPHYIRKQTLANAERFLTPELKELEERVTGADLKLKALEQELFEELRSRLARETPRLQAMGRLISTLDALTSLAEVAALHRYVCPEVDDGHEIRIVEGRHAVVERLMATGSFIPNDTRLDLENHRLVILTGPNMAGKSTYLRQVALIVLLAQIGSFVPAKQARIGLVDRIFTRVGASDNLVGGQSTFMVEMTETSNILHSATSRSLILLDEIGRGTSTYDGLSIAWAVAEFIHDAKQLGARTLFATHYHEMTQLEESHAGIKNYRVAVQERDGDVLFLRRIVRGGADKSYGIHVAQLAGLPSSVVDRAKQVLAQLERTDRNASSPTPQDPPLPPDASLPAPHPILEEVRQIDLFSMTPLDALNRLADLQRRLSAEE